MINLNNLRLIGKTKLYFYTISYLRYKDLRNLSKVYYSKGICIACYVLRSLNTCISYHRKIL